MELRDITPLILTYNEEANIGRTLKNLEWADRVVVLDSGSADDTLEIVSKSPNAEVFERLFDSMATQWNYGLSLVNTGWVLSLDADYQVTDELLEEIRGLVPEDSVTGYFISFRYCISGKPLRSSLLPSRQALFRLNVSSYFDDGHTQRLRSSGETRKLSSVLLHDDRKPFSRWVQSQIGYAKLEAAKLHESPFSTLSFSDKVRRCIIVAPVVVPLVCLIPHRGILDGWAGFHYAFQRGFAEFLLSCFLVTKLIPGDR